MSVYFGRCPKCMRQSFQTMVFGAALTLGLSLTGLPSWLVWLSALASLSAAALWLLHLAAFSTRAMNSVPDAADRLLPGTTEGERQSASRRRLLGVFVQSFLFAATATATLSANTALAANCPCAKTLKCCWNFTGDGYVCAPLDAVCCGSATSPWYCGRRQACNGTKGGCRGPV